MRKYEIVRKIRRITMPPQDGARFKWVIWNDSLALQIRRRSFSPSGFSTCISKLSFFYKIELLVKYQKLVYSFDSCRVDRNHGDKKWPRSWPIKMDRFSIDGKFFPLENSDFVWNSKAEFTPKLKTIKCVRVYTSFYGFSVFALILSWCRNWWRHDDVIYDVIMLKTYKCRQPLECCLRIMFDCHPKLQCWH